MSQNKKKINSNNSELNNYSKLAARIQQDPLAAESLDELYPGASMSPVNVDITVQRVADEDLGLVWMPVMRLTFEGQVLGMMTLPSVSDLLRIRDRLAGYIQYDLPRELANPQPPIPVCDYLGNDINL